MAIFPLFKKKAETPTTMNAMQRVTGIKTGWRWGFDSFKLDLTTTDNKKAFYSDPIIWRGINKKARDLLFEGFKIDSPIDEIEVPNELEREILQFLTEKHVLRKMHQAIVECLYSGRNGWLEYVCAGNKEPEQPLNGKLVDVAYVNCETITGFEFDEDNTFVEYWKTNTKNKNTGKYIKIHYSRLAFSPTSNPRCITVFS